MSDGSYEPGTTIKHIKHPLHWPEVGGVSVTVLFSRFDIYSLIQLVLKEHCLSDSVPKACICIISFDPDRLPKWILLISLLHKGEKAGTWG